MGATWTPWSIAILYLLDDDEWHEWDEAVTAGARRVPPGKAYRRGEQLRSRPDKHHNTGPRVRGDEGYSIHTGARAFARQVLQGMVRNGHIEQSGTNDTGARAQSRLWVRITGKGRKTLNEIEAAG